LRLTATDARGLKNTASVQLDPRTTTVTLDSQPRGLTLVAGTTVQATPFPVTLIEGSTMTVSAQSPQMLDGTSYVFTGWSDGGGQSHSVGPSVPVTLTATYQAQGP
jgi:hypothetical protein